MGTALLLASALAACTETVGPAQQHPVTPSEERASAPVVRAPLPQPVPAAPLPTLTPAPVLPEGALYVCVVEKQGERLQTVIEFPSPKVRELCRKNPEMGPCRYERDTCRRDGGRVYAASGSEITAQTEAEYDKKVFRVRFKSN